MKRRFLLAGLVFALASIAPIGASSAPVNSLYFKINKDFCDAYIQNSQGQVSGALSGVDLGFYSSTGDGKYSFLSAVSSTLDPYESYWKLDLDSLSGLDANTYGSAVLEITYGTGYISGDNSNYTTSWFLEQKKKIGGKSESFDWADANGKVMGTFYGVLPEPTSGLLLLLGAGALALRRKQANA